MQTFFSKYRILVWIVVLLLILNGAILGTILFRNFRTHQIIHPSSLAMRFQRPGPGVFLQEEIGLSKDQLEKYLSIRDTYQQHVREMNRHVQQLRVTYLQELMKTDPDKSYLKATSDSLGSLHVQLIEETGNYYMLIRQICREDQVPGLNAFFERTIRHERFTMSPESVNRSRIHVPGRNVRGNRNR